MGARLHEINTLVKTKNPSLLLQLQKSPAAGAISGGSSTFQSTSLSMTSIALGQSERKRWMWMAQSSSSLVTLFLGINSLTKSARNETIDVLRWQKSYKVIKKWSRQILVSGKLLPSIFNNLVVFIFPTKLVSFEKLWFGFDLEKWYGDWIRNDSGWRGVSHQGICGMAPSTYLANTS